MKAKELRDFLANVPDDMDVAVEDVEGKCIRVVDVYCVEPVLYLAADQCFPSDWYAESGYELPFKEQLKR